ncbi:F0F1 ATP synthase subunit A [Candidatus Omnitrophota bacterium]
MKDVGVLTTKSLAIPGLDFTITYNPTIMLFTGVVMLLIFVLAGVVARSIGRKPNRIFAAFELLYNAFFTMAEEAIGEDARKFTPLVLTIFLFALFSNWIGVIPGMVSPTQDLNTCLGLGLLVFVIAHATAIMKKGLGKYLKSYCEPFILFLPINVIGEIGKLVSHSFRLFGNIFAGAIIFALTGPVIVKTFSALGLPAFSASPLILVAYFVSQAFFGLFVGTVQALVFSLLALTYIAILRD